jgi:RNA polymerase sigma-70 factor (ECF subfamily)
MLMFMALDSDEERERVEYLYNAYKGLLMHKALHMLGSQTLAEEALADTFIEAMDDPGKIFSKSEIDFRNWSVVVIERKCISILRKETSKNKSLGNVLDIDDADIPDIQSDYIDINDFLVNKEVYGKLTEFLGKLSDINRQIIRMKYFEDKTIQQISLAIGLSITQINSRLERTRKKLRKMFESEASIIG